MLRIYPLMKSPEKYLCTPVTAVSESQIMKSSKIGVMAVPKKAFMELNDIFNGESVCLLDLIGSADEGKFDEPVNLIILVKKGSASTPTGWECEYDNKFKVVILDNADKTKKGKGKMPLQVYHAPLVLQQQNSNVDDELSSLRESDVSEVDSLAWNASTNSEEEPDHGESDDARDMTATHRINDDDRRDRTHEMSKHIDVVRYVVYSSCRLNQITVRWRDRERRVHRAAHSEAVRKLALNPVAKAMHGSRASLISKHGMGECVKRAQQWQRWRSVSSANQ